MFFPEKLWILSVLVNPAADELADHGILGDEAVVDVAEQQQGGEHPLQFLKALDTLRDSVEQLGRRGVHHRKLIGEGGVELEIRLFAED